MSHGLVLAVLYTFAMVEILLGLGFLYTLLRPNLPQLFHRINFKMSMVMFLVFSVGDILFGDRAELWEQGTFLILVIVSFEFFILSRTRGGHEADDAPRTPSE